MLSQLPGKLLLGGAEAIMLPHLSARARHNRAYRTVSATVEFTTALYWPALIVLTVLAHPIVLVLYGPSWLASAPLLQIIALAALFLFIGKFDIAVFIATGGLPDLLKRSVIVFPTCTAISTCSALFGVVPLAMSNWLSYPLQLGFSLFFIKRQISFSWPELVAPLMRGALVSIMSAIGPVGHRCSVLAAHSDRRGNLPGLRTRASRMVARNSIVGSCAVPRADEASRQAQAAERGDLVSDSEVRNTLQHSPMRTSESKDTSRSMILVSFGSEIRSSDSLRE